MTNKIQDIFNQKKEKAAPLWGNNSRSKLPDDESGDGVGIINDNVDNEEDENSLTGNNTSSRSSNLPSFTNCADGEIICLGILQSAKLKGYGETLYHGARVNWFTRMIPQWVLPGGIVYGYRSPHPKTLRKKLEMQRDCPKT